MSRAELYHVIIAVVGCVGWFWGNTLGLPQDAVEFCRISAIGIIGSAVGMTVKGVSQ